MEAKKNLASILASIWAGRAKVSWFEYQLGAEIFLFTTAFRQVSYLMNTGDYFPKEKATWV
jgi:hypothetical protein